jgi:uncharacterized membrane protein
MGENYPASLPIAMYGAILLFAGCAYYVLSRLLIARHGADSPLARAVGSDMKGLASLGIYALAIVLAFFVPMVSCALYVIVAIIWLVPDRRIERVLEH